MLSQSMSTRSFCCSHADESQAAAVTGASYLFYTCLQLAMTTIMKASALAAAACQPPRHGCALVQPTSPQRRVTCHCVGRSGRRDRVDWKVAEVSSTKADRRIQTFLSSALCP